MKNWLKKSVMKQKI